MNTENMENRENRGNRESREKRENTENMVIRENTVNMGSRENREVTSSVLYGVHSTVQLSVLRIWVHTFFLNFLHTSFSIEIYLEAVVNTP